MSQAPNPSEDPVLGQLPSRQQIQAAAATAATWTERFSGQQRRNEALGLTDAWFEAEHARSEALRSDYLRGVLADYKARTIPALGIGAHADDLYQANLTLALRLPEGSTDG